MQKWIRNYRAEFLIGNLDENRKFIPEEKITVEYPVTCQLDIDMGSLNSNGNRGTFQFYNLPENIRTKLWLDFWELGKKNKTIILNFYAGYQNVMPLVYVCCLQECTSQKPSGSVDWITQAWGYVGKSLDGWSFINQTASKGTKIEDLLQNILKDMPDVKLGYISPTIQPLRRNRTFIGQTLDILGREYGGYDFVIDKGELSILSGDEVLPGDILVITDSSGLLGSPRRSNLFVEVDMLFEPGLKIEQAVELLSDSMPQYNSLYKVIQIKHKGVISARQGGKLITTVTLALLTKEPKVLEKAVPTFQNQGTPGKWLKPAKGALTSSFGYRTAPKPGASSNHQGIDIGAAINSPVIATAQGKVIFTGWQDWNNPSKGYGQYIKIDHGNGLVSLYAHLNERLVSNGQTVSAGAQIGRVGNTGNITGPHLHFEIRKNGIAVNPLQYIGNY